MVVNTRRMTLDEFLALPEERPALEFVDGEVQQKVSPSTPHSAITLDFAMAVNLFARRRKLARAFPELRSTYGGMSTVPDVAVYTWDRIPRDGRGQLATQVFTPPDIAVEIRSPDQTFESNLIRCL
jgi:Uma2 family endonuclease